MLSPQTNGYSPKCEPLDIYFDLDSDECFTINYGGNISNTGTKNGFIRLLKWDKQSELKGWNILGRDGRPAYIAATAHSLGVTRNHILIFETAAQVEPFRMIGIRSVYAQQHRTPVWVIRKKISWKGVTLSLLTILS